MISAQLVLSKTGAVRLMTSVTETKEEKIEAVARKILSQQALDHPHLLKNITLGWEGQTPCVCSLLISLIPLTTHNNTAQTTQRKQHNANNTMQ